MDLDKLKQAAREDLPITDQEHINQEAYKNQMDTKAKQGGSLANLLGIVGTGLGGTAGGTIGSIIGGLFS